ncbi:uncharacterized protein LOC144317174 [Canis aureus]
MAIRSVSLTRGLADVGSNGSRRSRALQGSREGHHCPHPHPVCVGSDPGKPGACTSPLTRCGGKMRKSGRIPPPISGTATPTPESTQRCPRTCSSGTCPWSGALSPSSCPGVTPVALRRLTATLLTLRNAHHCQRLPPSSTWVRTACHVLGAVLIASYTSLSMKQYIFLF